MGQKHRESGFDLDNRAALRPHGTAWHYTAAAAAARPQAASSANFVDTPRTSTVAAVTKA